jgi:hypothetical protein
MDPGKSYADLDILPMDRIREARKARPQSANINIKQQETKKKPI